MSDTGRNRPCRCGSGRKYKLCCLAKEQAQRKPRRDEDALLILQPTRGAVCYETILSLDCNVGVSSRRLLRVARKPVDVARNELARHALDAVESGALFDFTPRETFILWVDDDAWLPPGLVTTMLQAMHEPALQSLDALFAWFCTRMPYGKPVAYRGIDDPASFPKIGVDCKEGDVVPIEAAGFHTVLMRARLLQRIGANPFTPSLDRAEGEDWAFCRRARDIGAMMAVGTSLPSAHIDPRDGTAYMPGMPAMLADGNELRQLTLEHLGGSGLMKVPQRRQYGLAFEDEIARADEQAFAALRADVEQRRAIAPHP